MKTDTVILPSDAEAVKFENSSFSLMPSLRSSTKRQTQASSRSKVSLEETNDTLTIRSPSGDTDIVSCV